MKISNRLLIALIAVLFAIPFIAMKNLKYKVDQNDFSLKYWDSTQNLLAGFQDLNKIRAVVLDYSAASKEESEVLHRTECKIVLSDSLKFLKGYIMAAYKITNNSFNLNLKNDTLFLFYSSGSQVTDNGDAVAGTVNYSPFNYTLELPKNVSITAINVQLVISEFNNRSEFDSLNIRLKQQSSLTINPDYIGYVAYKTPLNDSNNYVHLRQLNIECNASTLDLSGYLHLTNLSLYTYNDASVSIGKDVRIDQLSGRLSDSSWVGMANKYRKELK